MKLVFLDIDGVLNNDYTVGIRRGFVFLDRRNTEVFAKMMQAFWEKYGRDNVKIVLSSSWRAGVDKNGNVLDNGFRIDLDNWLEDYGLEIDDETPMIRGSERAFEILSYICNCKDKIDGYVVIDDWYYCDFKRRGITKRWLQTSWKSGLKAGQIHEAMRLIEKPVTRKEMAAYHDIVRADKEIY